MEDEKYDPNQSYCGPGAFVLPATSEANAICYAHDKDFGRISAGGGNPYVTSNHANSLFIQRMDKATNPGITGTLGKLYFRFANTFYPRLHSVAGAKRRGDVESQSGKKVKISGWTNSIRQTNIPFTSKKIRKRVQEPAAEASRSTRVRRLRSGVGSFFRVGPASFVKMPYAKKHRKKRGKKVRKRPGNKRSRHYRRHRNRGSFAKKVLNIVHKKDYPAKKVATRFFAGVCTSLVGAKTTPVSGRSVTWGRWGWKNPQIMNQLVKNLPSTAGTVDSQYAAVQDNRSILCSKYMEKHTIQNASNFPAVVVVYEFYIPTQTTVNSGGSFDSSDPGTAALELSAASDVVPPYNSFTDKTTSTYMYPLFILFKYNLFCKPLVNATSVSSDAERSWCTDDTFGAGSSTTRFACLSRPEGLMSFKFPMMKNELKLKKRKVITIGPGQQFSVSYVRKNKILRAEHFNITADNANFAVDTDVWNKNINKGGGGLLFHAVGLMSHDSTVSGATLNTVRRSTVILNHELRSFGTFRLLPNASQPSGLTKYDWLEGTAFTNNEVRSGITVSEYQKS